MDISYLLKFAPKSGGKGVVHDWWNNLVDWAQREQARDAAAADAPYSPYEAAYDRPPKNLLQMQAAVARRNPRRWRRMQRDLKWLEKRMKKMGLNPEDARWLL
jgi:hypothetical protein